MFQSFEDAAESAGSAERVARLRAALTTLGVAGVLVPRADEHQGEYVPACAERLAWLTGFSGSAGLAIVLARTAALFVDGRYVLQARAQADPELFEVLQTPEIRPSDWLKQHLSKDQRLGYDPRLHTAKEIERLEKGVIEVEATLDPLAENPVDAIWEDRPPPPCAPVVLHPLEHAGESAADKIARLQEALKEDRIDAAILTLPESIAWLLNIRGGDVPHTPVALAFAILHANARPELFISARKLAPEVQAVIAEAADICEPDALEHGLDALGQAKARVRLDPTMTAVWFFDRLQAAGAETVRGPDPCLLPKAKKNPVEIAGARAAHKRDGAAVCRFLAWLDREAASGAIDEITAAETLERLRAETNKLKEISFDTISGAGPNGAIVHYRVTRATNAPLTPGSLYLVDSGGQYADGTTDITRTIAIGEPTTEMRRHATLVLKGHIAVATARFPKGTRGSEIDPFARRALWEAGLDFDHGTGHGVGSYLSVHEGPARLSKLGTVPLEPGMILSNEPGYYREGQYGIRTENLVLVSDADPIEDGERAMMGFETLTLAPIDRRLIDVALLEAHEIAWLDAYHARVREEIGPALDGPDRRWLDAATAPLSGPPTPPDSV